MVLEGREVHTQLANSTAGKFVPGQQFGEAWPKWAASSGVASSPWQGKSAKGPLHRTFTGFGRWVVSSTGCFCRWVDARPPSGAA